MTTEAPAPSNGTRATARAVAPSPKPPTAPPKVSRLSQAKRGRVHRAPRIVIYGQRGVGKTTLATSGGDHVLLIDVDQGSDYLDVARYPFHPDQPNETAPRSFAEILDALVEIRDTETPFRRLVIDSIDRIEPLMWQHVLAQDSGVETPMNPKARKLNSIEDYGYGKGYQVAVDRAWIPFLKLLDEVRTQRGMTIVLVSHAGVRGFKNPTGDDYDRIGIRIHDKTAGPLVQEWTDVLAYYAFDDVAGKRPGADRARGVSTGRRVLHLEHSAVWDAKSRIPLPAEVEVAMDDPWRPFAEAIAEGQAMPREHLVRDVTSELARLGDAELERKTLSWCESASADGLWRCLSKLRHMAPVTQDNAADAPQEG
jgi:hypothetical protein